jgi:predicted transcriptional regulator
VTLSEVIEILDAEVLFGGDRLHIEVKTAFSTDLMSAALAFAKSGDLLLTGLTNHQVIRTAHILDVAAIVVVQGKKPSPETIQLAAEMCIPLLSTQYILFEAAGRLYVRGIRGCVEKVAANLW